MKALFRQLTMGLVAAMLMMGGVIVTPNTAQATVPECNDMNTRCIWNSAPSMSCLSMIYYGNAYDACVNAYGATQTGGASCTTDTQYGQEWQVIICFNWLS